MRHGGKMRALPLPAQYGKNATRIEEWQANGEKVVGIGSGNGRLADINPGEMGGWRWGCMFGAEQQARRLSGNGRSMAEVLRQMVYPEWHGCHVNCKMLAACVGLRVSQLQCPMFYMNGQALE